MSDTKEPTGTGEEAQSSPEKKVKVAQESSDKDTTHSQTSQLGALSGLAAYSSSESEDEQ